MEVRFLPATLSDIQTCVYLPRLSNLRLNPFDLIEVSFSILIFAPLNNIKIGYANPGIIADQCSA